MAEFLRFDFGQGEVEATPENTVAYTFRSPNEKYDHLYHMVDLERRIGAYIFKLITGEEQFMEALNHMMNNDYMCVINQPSELLTRGDVDAFNNLTKRISKREGLEIPDTLDEIDWDGKE